MAAIPEFEHLRKDFPLSRETWPTLQLPGRENLWAMELGDHIKSLQSGYPLAVKTRLGWALMGPKVTSQGDKIKSLLLSKQLEN